MQCSRCGAGMKTETVARYHYVECGLDDVYANNVAVSTCECGARALKIPNHSWVLAEAASRLKARGDDLTERERVFLDAWRRDWQNKPETLYIAQELPLTPPARRKDPCPCGSKKEYRKCHEGKLPRTQRVVWGFHTNGPMPIEAWAEKLTKPDFGFVETSYRRRNSAKPEKRISRIPVVAAHRERPPQPADGVTVSLPMAAPNATEHLSTYESIVFIDTNTDLIQGVSVTVALVSRLTQHGSFELIVAPLVREYRGLLPPQEVHGWRDVFDGMLELGLHRLGREVLVVVDSDLGQHEAWNRRSQPLLPPNYYLPAGFSLTYASGEREPEALFNRFMSMADAFATETMEHIRSNARGVEGLALQPLGAWCTYVRDWEITDERLVAAGFTLPGAPT